MQTYKALGYELSRVGEQLRKAKRDVVLTETEPALFTTECVTAAQDWVIKLEHRFTRLQDSYNAIMK